MPHSQIAQQTKADASGAESPYCHGHEQHPLSPQGILILPGLVTFSLTFAWENLSLNQAT